MVSHAESTASSHAERSSPQISSAVTTPPTPDELAAFRRGRKVFTRRWKPSEGLGPLYNATSCVSCHSHPVPGGSAPLYRNFYVAALDFGFALGGRPVGDHYYDARVETIFLLTDGRPIVAGKGDDREHILASVRRWNLNRRVVLNVVGLGDDVPRKFLRQLAEENGGVFAHEGAEPKADD